jgi:hypothetical protein
LLLGGDATDFVCHFGQILVLAEDKGHVTGAIQGAADHVKSDPDIDSLLVSHQVGKLGAVRKASLSGICSAKDESMYALPGFP